MKDKCTFCELRLTAAKNQARTDGRRVADGEVTTACAQACPTSAITFGNMADSQSQVAKIWARQQVELASDKQDKKDEGLRGYRIFEELRTYPSVLYLERVRNSDA